MARSTIVLVSIKSKIKNIELRFSIFDCAINVFAFACLKQSIYKINVI